jgi:hypothetical protein
MQIWERAEMNYYLDYSPTHLSVLCFLIQQVTQQSRQEKRINWGVEDLLVR